MAKRVPTNWMGLRTQTSVNLHLATAKYTSSEGWEAPEPRSSAISLIFKGN